jgi:uncharacterized protein (UPF0332 family)
MMDEMFIQRSKRAEEAAQLLYDNGFYDACVSRCYYSMFYLVQGLLMEKGIGYSTHGGIVSQFGRIFVKEGPLDVEYSKILAKAFERRMLGDYGQLNQTSQEIASRALSEAKRFNETIGHLSPEG